MSQDKINRRRMEQTVDEAVRYAAGADPSHFESCEPDSLLAAAEKAYQRARALVEERRPDVAHRAGLFAVIMIMIDERKGLEDLVQRANRGGHAPR